jgi:KaiC/GvpD/RAD55 family RecA-like ATPase
MDEKEWEGSFGVSQFDNATMGIMPPGTIGLFYGPPGAGKSSVLNHFLFQGARNGSNVCLITCEPPSSVASRITQFAGCNQQWLRDGYISILNIYDLVDLVGIKLGEMEEDDADLLYDLVVQVVNHLDVKRLVIDPVNPLLRSLESCGMMNFFQTLKGDLSKKGVICLLGYDTSREGGDWEQNPLSVYSLDIVVRFRKEREPPLVLNTLTIERWRSSSHARIAYVVDISDEGVVLVPRIKPLEVR